MGERRKDRQVAVEETAQKGQADASATRQAPPAVSRGDAERLRPYQWKPGQSGNPSGRPKSWLTILREEYGRGAEREIVSAIYGYATNQPELAGRDSIPAREQRQAAEYLANRIWGRVKESVEISGPGGAPLVQLSMDDRRQLYAFVVGGQEAGALAPGSSEEAGEVIDASFRALESGPDS